jgi:hypothetical protein
MRFPQLPPIINKQSCNPREAEYQQRTFYIFNDKIGIEEPKPILSIETSDFGPRGGASSRFLSKNY